MAERRDKPAEPEVGSRWPALPPVVKLSPVQEAWGAYVVHATNCQICRSHDAGRCDEAERLHLAYKEADAEALRRLREAL